jgi:hypothetical protein
MTEKGQQRITIPYAALLYGFLDSKGINWKLGDEPKTVHIYFSDPAELFSLGQEYSNWVNKNIRG